MTSPTDYREFALDCVRWAENASDSSQRQILHDMARHWLKIAIEVERAAPFVDDESRFQTLLKSRLD